MKTTIKSVLQSSFEPLTTIAVAEITGRGARSVHAELGQLVKRGRVVRVGTVPNKAGGLPHQLWMWVGVVK